MTHQFFQVNIAISTQNFAHKVQGNRTQTTFHLPRQASRLSLELLKNEALDAFGLFDVSLGDNMSDGGEHVNKDIILKEKFTLSVRVMP